MRDTTLLPVHPTKRHPLTGQPLQAVYVDKNGRARWPILGGAPDDPPKNDPPKPEPPKNDPPKPEPPKNDPDLGFPKDTPVAEMTWEQQAAYHRYHSRKHEQRSKDLRGVIGDKSPDELKSDMDELEELRKTKRTDAENAVEDAKRIARAEADAEWSTKLVRTALEGRLAHLQDEERDDLIDTVDLSKFLDNGDLDTEKVDRFVKRHTQPGTGTTRRWPDTGQGNRHSSKPSGVAAGQEMFVEGRKK